jgi:hypothetical protein
VNSLGLRDDENSLNAPEVIVISDSEAMGWGVEQQETFAQIIEARSGLRVLNAAVSSYGTAREFINLRRLDRSRLRTLVIQYCDNDEPENRQFYNNNNRLSIMSPAKYTSLSSAQVKMGQYYFGKELRYISRIYLDEIKKESSRLTSAVRRKLGYVTQVDSAIGTENGKPRLNTAELFLNVLTHGGVELKGIEIIVFEISNYGRHSRFLSLLQTSLSKDRRFESLAIKTIDVAKLLGPQHYYRLDGHLNAAGHRAMADMIIHEMGLVYKPVDTHAH